MTFLYHARLVFLVALVVLAALLLGLAWAERR